MMIVTKNLWSPTGIALPTELHGTPYILIPPRKLRSATTASTYPIRTIGLACQIIDVRSLCCDCIATIQHFLTLSTHPLSLTLLPTSLILHIGTHLVGDAGSEITLSFRQYLRIEYRPFHTISFRSLSLLPICRIHYVNGLPTCRDCHYTSLGVCGR